mmetsp:Transcript_27332/g.53738  ORF Transcript_27332/g.53738 Transcript_27332/m.53738 type:complete len:96 (+) Transcript_27332:653-940(+)
MSQCLQPGVCVCVCWWGCVGCVNNNNNNNNVPLGPPGKAAAAATNPLSDTMAGDQGVSAIEARWADSGAYVLVVLLVIAAWKRYRDSAKTDRHKD